MSSPKKSGSKRGGKKGTEKVSQSAKAGITFPVGRIGSLLRKGGYGRRFGKTTPVFVAAALEYVTSEVISAARSATKEVAGDGGGWEGGWVAGGVRLECVAGMSGCMQAHKKRLSPRTITMGIRGDEPLNDLLSETVISGGGVPVQIEKVLLKRRQSKKRKAKKAKKEKKDKKDKKSSKKKATKKTGKKKSEKKSKTSKKKTSGKKKTKKAKSGKKKESKKSRSPKKGAGTQKA